MLKNWLIKSLEAIEGIVEFVGEIEFAGFCKDCGKICHGKFEFSFFGLLIIIIIRPSLLLRLSFVLE